MFLVMGGFAQKKRLTHFKNSREEFLSERKRVQLFIRWGNENIYDKIK